MSEEQEIKRDAVMAEIRDLIPDATRAEGDNLIANAPLVSGRDGWIVRDPDEPEILSGETNQTSGQVDEDPSGENIVTMSQGDGPGAIEIERDESNVVPLFATDRDLALDRAEKIALGKATDLISALTEQLRQKQEIEGTRNSAITVRGIKVTVDVRVRVERV